MTALLPICAAAPAHAAMSYMFHLSCTDRVFVAQWDVGVIDPGKEYFRNLTEGRHHNCLVASYEAPRDAKLPVETYSVTSGAVQGVPVLGPVVCGVLGCAK